MEKVADQPLGEADGEAPMLTDIAADFSHESVIPDGTVLPRAVPYAGHAHPDSHLAPPGGAHAL